MSCYWAFRTADERGGTGKGRLGTRVWEKSRNRNVKRCCGTIKPKVIQIQTRCREMPAAPWEAQSYLMQSLEMLWIDEEEKIGKWLPALMNCDWNTFALLDIMLETKQRAWPLVFAGKLWICIDGTLVTGNAWRKHVLKFPYSQCM